MYDKLKANTPAVLAGFENESRERANIQLQNRKCGATAHPNFQSHNIEKWFLGRTSNQKSKFANGRCWRKQTSLNMVI